jgi:rhamnose transport system ATP-binding protein
MSTETTMSTAVSAGPVLTMTGITKAFGGVQALKGVDFDLRAGEVHALVGQNGAGKSTLIKILAGALTPDAGTISIEGTSFSPSSPADALHLGIGTVYQDPLVYPELSVTENIFMGRELRDRYGDIDWRAEVNQVRRLLQDLDVPPHLATHPIGSLSLALRQEALIAKSLSWEPKVMIFDEPTAILTQHEVETLFGIIRKLRNRGVGIIYISHRMEEIYLLADRVTVLKDGESKGTWPLRSVVRDGEQHAESVTPDQLIELMAGRALTESIVKTESHAVEPVLRVQGLTHKGMYQDVSFEVHPGEILGFFGLVGAGRSEVARAIFGEEPAEAGKIIFAGQEVPPHSPSQAVSQGIAYLPEDRKGQGIFGNLSVRYNSAITVIQRLATLGFVVQPEKEEDLAQRYVRDLSIKTPNTRLKVANLSGGNQQKVVLARWLATKPRLLILDEPTAGIDVSAKQEIHNLIVELARSGTAIMLISSELPEVLKLSDRVITMHEGVVTGEFMRNTAANTVLAAAMLETKEERNSTAPIEGPGASSPTKAQTRPVVSASELRALLIRRESIVLALLILGSLVFGLFHPTFFSFGNVISILSNVAVVAIISIAMTMVIVSGGIDVSVGSLLAVCMLMSAKVMIAGADNLLIALLVSLGIGLLIGAINGTIVAYGRIHPIIVTLGMLNIIRALHIQLLGPQWITPPPVARPLALGTFIGLPVPWWLLLILCFLASLFLRWRPLGRHIYALGGNTEAARLAGINVRGVIVFTYAAIGLLVGLAALIQLGQSGTVQPNTGIGLELQVIAATVIGGTSILGGRGTVIGSLIGALLIEAVHNALITLGTVALLEGLIVGILILIAVGVDALQNRKAVKV